MSTFLQRVADAFWMLAELLVLMALFIGMGFGVLWAVEWLYLVLNLQ